MPDTVPTPDPTRDAIPRLALSLAEFRARVPAELAALPNWVAWLPDKCPVDPKTGAHAKANAPSTWATLERAFAWHEAHPESNGVGFEFAAPYVGVDLDHVVDSVTREIEPRAVEIVARLASYAEFSPSGTGIHVIVRGALPAAIKLSDYPTPGRGVEMYAERRYFTVTGNRIHGSSDVIEDRGDVVAALHAELLAWKSGRRAAGTQATAPLPQSVPRETGAASHDRPESLAERISEVCQRAPGRVLALFAAHGVLSLKPCGGDGWYKGHADWQGVEKDPAFGVHPSTGSWCDHRNGDVTGGLLAFLQRYRHMTEREAAREVCRRFDIGWREEKPRRQPTADKPPTAFLPIDAVDALATPIPPLEYLIEDFLSRGARGWIAALPKSGKSWVGLHAVVAVATGTLFLGRFPTREGRALYVSEEDSARIVLPRLRDLLAATGATLAPDRLHVLIREGFRVDDPPSMEWLAEYLTSWPADLVVMDVFGRLHQQDINDATAITPILRALDAVVAECGCALWIVTHYRKPSQNDSGIAGTRVSGSVALHGWSECSIYIDCDGHSRIVTPEAKEWASRAPMLLTIGASPDGRDEVDRPPVGGPVYVVAHELPSPEKKRERTAAAVADALNRVWRSAGQPAEGVTAADVLADLTKGKTPMSERTVRQYLGQMGARIDGSKGRYNPPQQRSTDAKPLAETVSADGVGDIPQPVAAATAASAEMKSASECPLPSGADNGHRQTAETPFRGGSAAAADHARDHACVAHYVTAPTSRAKVEEAARRDGIPLSHLRRWIEIAIEDGLIHHVDMAGRPGYAPGPRPKPKRPARRKVQRPTKEGARS